MNDRIEGVAVEVRLEPGPYAEHARFMLEMTEAEAIVLIVVNGARGSGVTVLGNNADLPLADLATVLRGVSEGITDTANSGAGYHAAG